MGTTDIAKDLFNQLDKDKCFYCGGGLLQGQTYVYWSGFTEGGITILLHPSCTFSIAKHLIKDALVIRRKADELDDRELATNVLQIIETIDRLGVWHD